MVKREATEATIPSWSFHLFQCLRSEVRFIIVKVRSFHVCCVYKKQKSLKSRRWKSETTRWNHLNISWNIQLIQNSQYDWYSNDRSIDSLKDLILAQLASVVSFPPVSSSQLSSSSVCYRCVLWLLSAVPVVLCLPIYFSLLFLLFILSDPPFPIHQCFRS